MTSALETTVVRCQLVVLVNRADDQLLSACAALQPTPIDSLCCFQTSDIEDASDAESCFTDLVSGHCSLHRTLCTLPQHVPWCLTLHWPLLRKIHTRQMDPPRL